MSLRTCQNPRSGQRRETTLMYSVDFSGHLCISPLLTSCHRSATPMSDASDGEAVRSVGGGAVYGNSLLPAQFFHKPKTALKIVY